MEKQTKITYILFGLAILSVILHNAISAYFKAEEPVFFVLTFLFLFAFVFSVIRDTISYIKKGQPRDLWKIGFLGLFGLMGLVASPGFFGLFGLFGFFGAKGWRSVKNKRSLG